MFLEHHSLIFGFERILQFVGSVAMYQ